MVFNEKNRSSNILKSSMVSTICNVLNIFVNFIYRTVFIRILSIEYLGLNGLFTNILSILSLADLGISVAISYRLYKPIHENDVEKVGQMMDFFKTVYRIIMLVIVGLGLLVVPFLPFLIKDTSEVPSDINLTVIYLLYLLQTLSTYMFAYKQTILSADQKQYLVALLQFFINVIRNVIQIAILVIWKNFVLSLAISILSTIFLNWLIALWVDKEYKPVFEVKSKLSKEEKSQIYKDTKASMYHRVGGVVLSSTDSIILSKFISLAATGMYSNYAMITRALSTVLAQLFGSFTASLGNLHVSESKEVEYKMFKNLFCLNLWIAGFVSMNLFLNFNDFIEIWVGKKYCFNDYTVLIICIQFYLETIRFVQNSFTTATGLFVKDRIRPLIESAINLIVSIICVKWIGLPGVFLGTIISHLLTVIWREPLILYRYEFKRGTGDYWLMVGKYSILVILFSAVMYWILPLISYPLNIVTWVLKAGILSILFILFSFIILYKSDEFSYCVSKFGSIFKRGR